MARPNKQIVDYFPHSSHHGQTITLLERRFGNNGYAVWFKLLEILAHTEGHFINLNEPGKQAYLEIKFNLKIDEYMEILDELSSLNAIDPELYERKVIWSDNFIQNIEDVYRTRKSDLPDKPIFIDGKLYKNGANQIKSETIRDNPRQSETIRFSPQSKLKETKLKETKTEEIIEMPPLELQAIKLYAIWGRAPSPGEKNTVTNMIKNYGWQKVWRAFHKATDQGNNKWTLAYVRGILNQPEKLTTNKKEDRKIGE